MVAAAYGPGIRAAPDGDRVSPQPPSSVRPDAARSGVAHDEAMSYAVLWRENGGPQVAGAVSLECGGLELSGSAAPPSLPYTELRELYLDRSRAPSLVLVTSGGDRFAIGSLQGLGA